MSIWLAFVVNSIPYERGPIQTLTCHYELLSILEASEQASGTWPTMPHVQSATALGLLASSYLISTGSFSPTKGSIHIYKYDGYERHPLGSTSQAQ